MRCGKVRAFGPVWSGSLRSGLASNGLVRRGESWRGSASLGEIWFGPKGRYGAGGSGGAMCATVRSGRVWNGVAKATGKVRQALAV